MAIRRFDDDMSIVVALDDEPNDVGGMTSTELKMKFDEAGKRIQTYLNETLIPEMDGSLATKEEVHGIVLGQIPDGTITDEKLSPDVMEKIDGKADDALSPELAAALGLDLAEEPQVADALWAVRNSVQIAGEYVKFFVTTMPSSSGTYYSVAYGGGRFVATGSQTLCAYSEDGVNWLGATMPSSGNWKAGTYGGGKFVSMMENSNKAAYSADGISWTEVTLPSSSRWHSVAYGGGRFVATVFGGHAAYSDDGINWTAATMPSSNNWRNVTYGGGRFVAVTDGQVAYSSNGINWTAVTLPAGTDGYSVTYGGGRFVVTGNSALCAYSDDGISWAAADMSHYGSWRHTAYGKGWFVAITNSTNMGACSRDGVSWLPVPLGTALNWGGVGFGADRFLVVATGQSARYGPILATLTDIHGNVINVEGV